MPKNKKHSKSKPQRYFVFKSIKSKQDARRTPVEKLADWLTSRFGSITFLLINIIWFVLWIIINLGFIPNIAPFDPYPFGLLTMIVSLEAIALAIIVLISQNREEKINDLRGEVDLQVDFITQKETTKILHLLKQIATKAGVDLSNDKELKHMLEETNVHKIESIIEKQHQKK